jgi:hypothetical protein
MAQTLEWFQCTACGRRHRWQADIAGTEIRCPCGASAFCPQVEVFADADAPDAVVEPMPTSTAGPARRVEASLGIAAELPAPPRTYRGRGMSPFTKALLWSIAAAIGFVLLIHALIVQLWVYIALTVLWTPFSFLMFLKARKRWQGNRSLKRAFLEQVDPDSLAD